MREFQQICVPRPVILGANQYSRRILWHLYNLFSPRTQEQLTSDVASRQALLCHRVLRRVQNIATKSPILEQETWQEILSFLLAINDVMLSDRQCKGWCIPPPKFRKTPMKISYLHSETVGAIDRDPRTFVRDIQFLEDRANYWEISNPRT